MRIYDFIDKFDSSYDLSRIVELDLALSGHELDLNDQILCNLTKKLTKCTNLEAFRFPYGFIGLNVGITNYKTLFDALKGLPKLKKIDFAFNYLGYLTLEDFGSLCDLISSAELRSINLMDNYLDKLNLFYLQQLCDSLSNAKNLEYLNLSNNNLNSIDNHKFNILCNGLLNCYRLSKLFIIDPPHSKERQVKLSKIHHIIMSRNMGWGLDLIEDEHIDLYNAPIGNEKTNNFIELHFLDPSQEVNRLTAILKEPLMEFRKVSNTLKCTIM